MCTDPAVNTQLQNSLESVHHIDTSFHLVTYQYLPNIINSFLVKSEAKISIWSVYEQFDVIANARREEVETKHDRDLEMYNN